MPSTAFTDQDEALETALDQFAAEASLDPTEAEESTEFPASEADQETIFEPIEPEVDPIFVASEEVVVMATEPESPVEEAPEPVQPAAVAELSLDAISRLLDEKLQPTANMASEALVKAEEAISGLEHVSSQLADIRTNGVIKTVHYRERVGSVLGAIVGIVIGALVGVLIGQSHVPHASLVAALGAFGVFVIFFALIPGSQLLQESEESVQTPDQ